MAGGKTQKKQSKRSPALTEHNKKVQARARLRRRHKMAGQAAQKRQARRAFLKEQRLTDPSYARKLPDAEPKISHNALNKDTRGSDQVIYSVILTPYRD